MKRTIRNPRRTDIYTRGFPGQERECLWPADVRARCCLLTAKNRRDVLIESAFT